MTASQKKRIEKAVRNEVYRTCRKCCKQFRVPANNREQAYCRASCYKAHRRALRAMAEA
jgi:hypothetical protein